MSKPLFRFWNNELIENFSTATYVSLKIQIQSQIQKNKLQKTKFFLRKSWKAPKKCESVLSQECPPIKFNNFYLFHEAKTNREAEKIKNIEKVNFNHIHITTLIFSLRPLKKTIWNNLLKPKDLASHILPSLSASQMTFTCSKLT